MDMPLIAITIAREMGAGGAVLGRRLAKRLGFTYLDRAILRLAAKRAGTTHTELAHWDEHVSRFWERIADLLVVSPAEAVYTQVPTTTCPRDRDLFELESQIIREIASRRNVVVIGRGGFWSLRQHPGLVSVYLHAPLAARVAEVKPALDPPDERQARDLITRTDADRARFLREMTGCTCGDPSCFALSIDTAKAGMDLAEEMVVRLVEHVRAKLMIGTAKP